MRINAYLNFNGTCAAAFECYAALLGGKITLSMTYGASPMAADTAPEMLDKVLHATLMFGGQILQGSDVSPDRFDRAQGFSMSISVKDMAEAQRIFDGLCEGARIMMPLQPTFWSPGFAMLTDRFGTPWMINVDAEA